MTTKIQASGETDFDRLTFDSYARLDVPFPAVSGVSVPNNNISVPMGPNALVIANQRGAYHLSSLLSLFYLFNFVLFYFIFI